MKMIPLFEKLISLILKDDFISKDASYELGEEKIKIGFVINGRPDPYHTVMASTRLRVYDIINYLNQTDTFSAELYKSKNRFKYDVVIFQKFFNSEAIKLAKALKEHNVKIILDINVNYYEESSLNFVNEEKNENIYNFTKIVDGVISTTESLQSVIKKIFPEKRIAIIPENIGNNFFKIRKKHEKKEVVKLVYVGYAVKAKEILLIEEILENLGEKFKIELLFICEKNPKICFNNLKSTFIKYKNHQIDRQITLGDIKIAPRDLSDSYNKTHSFTKIGYPMALGLPVVASPLKSYINSPAVLCETSEEWEENLEKLILNHQYREELSIKGVEYCKKFSIDIIGEKYENFIIKILKEPFH